MKQYTNSFRFAGHETFYIREGWLHKGLKLLLQNPTMYAKEELAYELGVGRNMAKAIRFWLMATGLAERSTSGAHQRIIAPTELAKLIANKDPYFLDIGTWWALHINLVTNPRQAGAWFWFFNYFAQPRFDRAVCLENLVRFLKLYRSRLPSRKTLERDVSCLLASYSREIPRPDMDPEDGMECPFRALGLLTHHRESGYYRLNLEPKAVPAHLMGYAIAKMQDQRPQEEKVAELPFETLLREPKSLGRAFCLTGEALYEELVRAEQADVELEIVGFAAERIIRTVRKRPIDWLKDHYRSSNEAAHAA